MFSYTIIHSPKSFSIDELRVSKIFKEVWTKVPISQKGIIHIAFLLDEEISLLNTTYRGKEGTTDVLSFHYFDDFSKIKKTETAWEVILSEAKIIMQSQEYGHTLEEEFEILLIHSLLLHLLGFDHEEEEDFHDMWKYESEIRSMFSLNAER